MIMPLPGVGRHPYISVLKKNVFEVPTSGNICKVLVTNGSLKWYLTTVKASLLPFMIFKKEKKKSEKESETNKQSPSPAKYHVTTSQRKNLQFFTGKIPPCYHR